MAMCVSPTLPSPSTATEYWTDAWQRSILYLDVMRRRTAQFEAHAAEVAPNVLDYKAELVADGRRLARPVNYLLALITPPEGVTVNPRKRPFVIVDPRAGHGPGIGGFKPDSEIGVALRAGHPVYFVGFLPEPVPGQTILDVAAAEASFLETVIARHPDADGKPAVIGNCQAGWAVMIVAALRPELFGPIILAGAPLSYWAGVRGKNPMRYSGGLMGGSWLTALAGDLGAGIFDGAALVQNFENQNPANTLWTKQYNLWSRIDTEPERYLDFERWWGGHVLLNAAEMQWIVDQLFVGNHLSAGDIRADDGTAVDLRVIRSPIVVFCSKGDNITPPQQALGWILDLYDSVDDIRGWGQTIVYTVHESVGHLGIFVSGGVARKEHDKFASNIDLIDVLPPGLYEAVLTPKDEAGANADLIGGDWVMRCEARTLDDIRAMGGNDLADDRRFEAAARVSEVNLALYRAFAQPVLRAMVSPQAAEMARRLHPSRISYEMFGPRNPWLGWVEGAAARVRAERRPVAPGNPLLAAQGAVSDAIVEALDGWRAAMERLSEEAFLAIYGAPALQAALGIDTASQTPPRKAARSRLHQEALARRTEALRQAIPQGGLAEALVRALVYVGLGQRSVEERRFAAITRLRDAHPASKAASLAEFKALVRAQFQMLLLDEDAALRALPAMLPEDAEERRAAFAALREVAEASGVVEGDAAERLQRVAAIFGVGPELAAVAAPTVAQAVAPVAAPAAPRRSPRSKGAK